MKFKTLIIILLMTLLIGGASLASSEKYDLGNFGYRYVDSKGRGSLVFQQSPRGKSMKGHKFYTGDRIYVNLYYRESGYGIAYENGEYGYVDASYIDWGNSGSRGGSKKSGGSTGSKSGNSSMSSSDKNLSNYEYRRVRSNGRGSLVFQKAPRGQSMKGHKFYDGDWIYVNVNYRRNGYSIAYENGEYGYVDASYIDWNSGDSGRTTSSGSGSRSNHSNSGYGGSGNVTFTGNANVRTGPGLDYSIIGAVNKGMTLNYAGDTQYDNRNVAWYCVYYDGGSGWVSSKYASLKDNPSGYNDTASENYLPAVNAIELSEYYENSVENMINALGGGFTVTHQELEDGVNVVYEKGGLFINACDTSIVSIVVERETQYSLKGVTIGMTQSEAEAILRKYPYKDGWGYVVKGQIDTYEALLYIEYTNGCVDSMLYGIYS